MQRTVKAFVTPGEDGWYVVECANLPVVTQGRTLDEAMHNLSEAVALALEGEDPSLYGLADATPAIVVTLELSSAHAA